MGHVSVDFVWKAVMKDERLGLKVRWAFLGTAVAPPCSPSERHRSIVWSTKLTCRTAKSHVYQHKVTGRQYQVCYAEVNGNDCNEDAG